MNKLLRIETIIVYCFISIYALASILVSLNRYWQFNAFWYDFGILDSVVWQFSRFQLPLIFEKAPPNGMIIWGDHFNPSMAFIAPLYWLTNKQEIIIVFQTIFVCLGAIVAYIISKKIVNLCLTRIALIVSFLGFVGMQNALFTDVHYIVIAVFPLMLTIWATFTKHWKLYYIFLLVTIGFQENIALIGIMIGLYLIFSKINLKAGLISILICLLYFIIVTEFIIPFYNHSAYLYQPKIAADLISLLRDFFSPSIKIKTVFYSFASFGFFPLFSASTWPLIIEQYSERFILNSVATRWDLGFHYNAPMSPILFLSTLVVIKKLQNKNFPKNLLKLWSLITICLVIFLHRFYLHGPLMMATMPAFYKATEDTKFLYQLLDKIPKGKFMMVPNNLGSHLSHEKMVLLHMNYKKINPDIIVFDVREGQNANNFYPLSFNSVKKFTDALNNDKKYKRISVTHEQFYFIKI